MDVIIMKFDPEIKGTCELDNHKEEIELLSFNHGVSMQITGDVSNTERTSGKPNHQDFTVTRYLDKATPKINEACCKAENFTSLTVTIARNDKGTVIPLIIYTMKNVIISSVSVGGGASDKPLETVTFNYNHITWDFHAQKDSGTEAGHVDAKWDLARNAAA